MPRIDRDLTNFLDNDQSISLTKGVNLFTGPVRDADPGVPDDAVFISTRGGRIPDRIMGLSYEIRSPIAFIRVRNRKYDVGHAMALSILNILRAAKITGYLDVEPLQSEPEFVAVDDNSRFLWDLAYVMRYQEGG